MAITLISPHRFKERILLFGGGGSGKSETVLNIASHVQGEFYIYDNDTSFNYNRALQTTYQDLDDTGRVHVYEATDNTWEDCLVQLTDMVGAADPDTDWLVIDSITPTWGWVQNWYQEQVHGQDLARHMIQLKREYADDQRGYNAAVTNDMNWPVVKKEYEKLYRVMQQWKGHLIITAEAKGLGRDADDDMKMLYGHLGMKPSGEGRLHHIASTNLLLTHPGQGEWKVTTVKDRNREELDGVVVEDFGKDYLMDVAGWKVKRKKPKPETTGDDDAPA